MDTARTSLITLALSLCLTCTAQQDTLKPVFRDLSEALRTPHLVKRLDLSDQALQGFPIEVLRFTGLEELRLRRDGITDLPEGIGSLKNLRLLDLSGNPITELPAGIGELTALEEFYLNDDPLLDLEHDLPTLAKLPRLRVLHLSGDGIERLPGAIRGLEHLEELYLANNTMETFPADLINLPVLKLIDLHANPMRPLIPMELQQRGVLVRF
ncbi:MAG TPA: leucine-rich repeat domain-containing protein [Flavobacteriales bacterium]|nr:leucine-rich repeat domain-containing protein [Flavobacteriales bacterium]